MPDTRDIPPRLALTSDYWELATVPPVVVAPLPGTRLYVDHAARVLAARAAAASLRPYLPLTQEDPTS